MYCPTCQTEYPPTPDHWLLQSRRRRDKHGASVCDSTGTPIEDWRIYCRLCQTGKAAGSRRCGICKQVKPRTEEHFRRSGPGFLWWCKPCQDRYLKEYGAWRRAKKSA